MSFLLYVCVWISSYFICCVDVNGTDRALALRNGIEHNYGNGKKQLVDEMTIGTYASI